MLQFFIIHLNNKHHSFTLTVVFYIFAHITYSDFYLQTLNLNIMKKITLFIYLLILSVVIYAQNVHFIENGLNKTNNNKSAIVKSAKAPITTLSYCSDIIGYNIGIESATTINSAIELPASTMTPYTGNTINKIIIGVNTANLTGNVTVKIWSDIDTEAGTVIASETVPVSNLTTGWNEVLLSTPYTITGSEIYVGYTCSSIDYGCLTDNTNAHVDGYGDWTYIVGVGTTWLHLSEDLGADRNWQIKAVVDDGLGYNDATIIALSAPISECDMSATQEITATIKNNGTQDITEPFDMAYAINEDYASQIILPVPVPLSAGTNVEVSFILDMSSDGEYNIEAYTLLSNDANNENDTSMINCINTVPDIVGNDGYTNNLNSDLDLAGMHAFNENNDATTWGFFYIDDLETDIAAIYQYSVANNANDWLVLNCIDMEAGDYILKFDYRCEDADFPEKLKVFWGTAADPSSLTNEIIDLNNITEINFTQNISSFSIPDDGIYYIGFQAYSDANMFILAVDNIEILNNSPIASVNPTSWNAGDVELEQTSTSETFTLTNIGQQTLTVSNATILAEPWSTTFDSGLVSLNTGESYDFSFNFTPSVLGDDNIDFVISSNGGDITIPLSGTGIEPLIPIANLDPTSWNASDVEVGQNLVSSSFTLTNTGEGILTVSNTTALTSPWSTTLDAGSISIGTGESYNFDFTFTPTSIGEESTDFVITTNGGELTIQLSGNGTEPIIPIASINQDSWAFETVEIGQDVTSSTFTLTNNGNGTLTVSNASSLSAPWATTFDAGSVNLAAGESYDFSFNFAPNSVITASSNFTITTNGGNITVSLSGTGVNPVTDPMDGGFENNVSDFDLHFDGWVQHDLDQSTTYIISDKTFLNQGYTGSFIAFNPSSVTPAITGTSTQPHSGNRYGACFNAVTANAPNDDWLITPKSEVINDGTIFRMYVKSYYAGGTGNPWGLERYCVYVSTTGTQIADFTKISAGDYEEAPVVDWTPVEYDLSAYAGQQIYIGIQCISNDVFFFMVDDLEIDYLSQVESNDIKSISVYPNPANNVITVDNAENMSISIYNMVGQSIINIENADTKQRIDISDLSNGTYLIKVNSEVIKINVLK